MSIFTLVIWGGFWLRVHRLSAQSFWWDELSTVARTAVSLPALFENLFTVRNHMPLYFLIMRLWSNIGQDEFVMRYFSLLCGILMLPLIYKIGCLLANHQVGLSAAFLLAISPFHIWYSQETRMYTLVSLMVLLTHWFLFRLLIKSRRKAWIGYTAAFTVAVYTHYLALFLLLAHYVFFSLNYRKIPTLFRQWLFYGGVVGGLFGIWGGWIFLTGGFENAPIGWIQPAAWHEPLLTLFNLTSGPTTSINAVVGWVLLGLFSVGVWAAWQHGRATNPLAVQLLLLWLLVPLLLQFMISLDLPIPNKRSIYVDRYLINSLPAYLLLVAWGLHLLPFRKLRRAVVPLALLIIMLGTIPSLMNLYTNSVYARENYRAAYRYLAHEWQPNEILFLNSSQTLPLDYYGDTSWPIQLLPFEFDLAENPNYFTEELPAALADLESVDRVWILTAVENTNPHTFPQERNLKLTQLNQEDPFLLWFTQNHTRLQIYQTSGIQLTQFELIQEQR